MATVDILPWILLGAQWLLAAAGVVLLLLLAAALCLPAAFSVRTEGALDADESAEYGFTGAVRWQLHFSFGWSLFRADLEGENLQVTQKEMSVLGFRLPPRSSAASRRKRGRVRCARFKRAGPGRTGPGRTKSRRAHSNRTLVSVIRVRELSLSQLRTYWAEGRWLLKRGARALRLAVQGDVTYGLGDPSLTGLTAAFLAAAGVPHGFRATPDFLSPGVRGWTALQGRTYGGRVLGTGIAFLFRPAICRLWLSKLKHSTFRRRRREGGSRTA